MGSLYKADVVRLALDEIGYQGAPKSSKYSRDLDAVNYWNMGSKEGAADWCSIFFNWLIYQSTRNSSGEIDPDVWDAHFFTYEPDGGQNLAAGCGYAADYYMARDAWSEGGSDYSRGACVGDQVFFRNFAHTGIVVDWDNEYIYTVEGNVSGNQVLRRKYKLNDSDIDGYGHPRYDGDEYPSGDNNETPKPTPEPTPEPEPDPTPSPDRYEVTTNGGVLRLRAAPNTSSAYLIGIPNGTELEVTDIVEGESIDYVTDWARTCYAGYNGYVSCRWITKI